MNTNRRKLEEYKLKNKNLITPDTLDDSKELLNKHYTLSFSEACKILKCSRAWVSRFIKPNVKYMYVKYMSPLRFKKYQQDWPCQKDCVYFSRKDFNKLFMNGIKNVTRQAINLPLDKLIKEESREKVCNLVKNSNSKIEKAEAEDRPIIPIEQVLYYEIINEHLLDVINIKKDVANVYKRGKCPFTKVKLPESFNINNIQAVHDLKDYGDTDELIYRDLFKKSAYRFELELADKNGVPSKKIFYYESDTEKEISLIKNKTLEELSDYEFELCLSYDCYKRIVKACSN